MSPCFVLLALLASPSPVAALHVRRKDPLDSVAEADFEGPDMIPLFPNHDYRSPLPPANAAAEAKRRQEYIDNHICHVTYTHGGNVYLIRDPRLKPYLLNSTANSNSHGRPVVVVAPGGGNGFLAWHREGTSVAKWLNSIGLSAFVLAYRVPSDGHGALVDAQRAVSWVRHNAPNYGLDPDRIIFMGFSAGGYLTADISVYKDRVYGNSAIPDPLDHVDFHPNFAMLIYGAGPELLDGRDGIRTPPPTFSISAEDDPCVSARDATRYCEQVRQTGQECERHVYPNGGHGFGVCDLYTNEWSGEAACDWKVHARVWLKGHDLI